MSPGLDLDLLREVNARRRARWHSPDTIPWTGADWGNAMGGECGEAQNVVKKLRRIETGTGGQNDPAGELLIEMLGDELADLITYADILAEHYGIDLSDAIARKFNAVSKREGFPDRLPRREEHPDFDACPEGGGRVAEESETYRVSPAPQGDAGSRERLDPLAATSPSVVSIGADGSQLCMKTVPVVAGTCGPLPPEAHYTYLCVQPLPCPTHGPGNPLIVSGQL